MRIRVGLLRFMLCQMLTVTLTAAAVAVLYVLLVPRVLKWRDFWPAVFVLGHTCALTSIVWRFKAGSFAFLYTRGYSRDALWAHTMVASVMCALAVWVPAALIVWTRVRSLLQDHVFLNAEFPIMAPRELWVPLAWLAGYAVWLPVHQYAWIRSAQPTRDRTGGKLMLVGLAVAVLCIAVRGRHAERFQWLVCGVGGIVVAVTLLAGLKIHRRLEVEA